jgi:hypothetical protein
VDPTEEFGRVDGPVGRHVEGARREPETRYLRVEVAGTVEFVDQQMDAIRHIDRAVAADCDAAVISERVVGNRGRVERELERAGIVVDGDAAGFVDDQVAVAAGSRVVDGDAAHA